MVKARARVLTRLEALEEVHIYEVNNVRRLVATHDQEICGFGQTRKRLDWTVLTRQEDLGEVDICH